MRERPTRHPEETGDRAASPALGSNSRKKQKVHSLIDKVYSPKNLELAWEKVRRNRGSAGIDEVTIAEFTARKECYLELLHRKLRDGTYRPQPVKRVEMGKVGGGVRKLGIPAVLDRVCQQALVQRLDRSLNRSSKTVPLGIARDGRLIRPCARCGAN